MYFLLQFFSVLVCIVFILNILSKFKKYFCKPKICNNVLKDQAPPQEFYDSKEFKYEVVKKLGAGAFGAVSQVLVHNRTKRIVYVMAMKQIIINDQNREKALDEYKIHSYLSSNDTKKHLVGTFGMRKTIRSVLIFMELATGQSLYERMKKEDLGVVMIHDLFKQIVSAVEFIHQYGFVHRDIKPENMLITGSKKLKLADFGLAAQFRFDGQEYLVSGGCGTGIFAPPENWTGHLILGPPFDIWSTGMVLMCMVTGEDDFWSKAEENDKIYRIWISPKYSEDGYWNTIDPRVFGLIRKMVCPDVGKRATIEDIKNDNWLLQTDEELENCQQQREQLNAGYLSALHYDCHTEDEVTPLPDDYDIYS